MVRQKLILPVGQTSRLRYGNLCIYNEGHTLKVYIADSIPNVDKAPQETLICTLNQNSAKQLAEYLLTAIGEMTDKPTW